MWGKRTRAVVAALMLTVAACSDTATDPTLAPGTTAPVTTATTTTAPATTTTTTTAAPTTTTTQSPDERLAEIQALAKEAYVGRMRAIYAKDPDALLEWVGSQASYDGSIAAMELATFLQEPRADNLEYLVEDVLLDRSDCVVVRAFASAAGVVEGATGTSRTIAIYWPAGDGRLLDAAVWQDGTPEVQWIEECDIAQRGVTP